MGKTAIILTGGGIRCSYSLGAMLALAKEHGIKKADIIIAGSGGAPIASYYITEQYDYMKTMWEAILSDKKLIDPLRFWKIIDIDHLIDNIFKKKFPLDYEGINNSGMKLVVSATDAAYGTTNYFFNDSKSDIFEVMRATSAIPLAYGKKVRINGKEYIDSYTSSLGINLKIMKAIELGADKILIISTREIDTLYRVNFKHVQEKKIFDLWLMAQRKIFIENYNKEDKIDAEKREYHGVKIVSVYPSKPIKISMLAGSQKSLTDAVHLGYEDMKNCKEVKSLFEK